MNIPVRLHVAFPYYHLIDRYASHRKSFRNSTIIENRQSIPFVERTSINRLPEHEPLRTLSYTVRYHFSPRVGGLESISEHKSLLLSIIYINGAKARWKIP